MSDSIDYIDIDKIQEWDYNARFRAISPKGQEMLEKNSKFGQHSTVLLYFSPDGKIISLGGNQRLRMWRNDPNYKQVKYIKLEFVQDAEGLYPVLDGRVYKNQDGTIPFHFKSIEAGMIAMALSHNGQYAHDLSDEIANMVGNFPDIDFDMHTAVFNDPISIVDIQKIVAPEGGGSGGGSGIGPSLNLTIVFKNTDDKDNARAEIADIIANYEGAKFKREDKI